jgi:hypothetical protein
MRKLSALTALSATLVSFVSLGTASATTTLYTNRAAFLAAVVTPTTTVDFEGIAPTGGTTNVDGQTLSGVTFSDWWGYTSVIDPAYFTSYYDWNSGQSLITYYYGDPIFAAPPAGTRAIGADLGAVEYYTGATPQTMDVVLTLADASQVVHTFTTQARPNLSFVGFIADQDIVDISFATPDISNLGYYPFALVDNVTYTLCDDADADAVCDDVDNCVGTANPSQADSDQNGAGDACEVVCVTFRRDLGSNVADAMLSSWASSANTNFGAAPLAGAGQAFLSDTRQTLLSFDVSAIPTTALVVTADITVSVVTSSGTSAGAAHQVLAPWSEGSVTWNSFGGAYAGAAVASFAAGVGLRTLAVPALAQGWVDGSTPNHGIVLERGTSVGQFSRVQTSEGATAADKPQLQLCYVIPG